ncbi:exporter of the RND superfamily protein-like protein [Planctopirus limnophila DSM 3776]|uniref:Exporter of the RND superfamily protein-like protein n=1 Tax=Planctopirus limnophila (strain ATCC 43296 / DSM 3776 / IFAM 1008 / Mu 290) TaxID=521674 RepID=D5SU60_PLAL2|nr:MMPL family transporter [Planctopirus limnophila]ADG69113.1 exporter of the RND superfamily protein-like protein [Planctopirus limnophila DSM 3776]
MSSNFFDRRDPWGHGYGVYIFLLMLFLIPPALWGLKQTNLQNDVENWLPSDDPQLKILKWAHSRFPVEDRIFITWDSSSLSDPRIARLAQKLEGVADAEGIRRDGMSCISRVVQPGTVLRSMIENGVEFHEAVRRLEGTIIGAGPLKLRLTPEGRNRLRTTERQLAEAIREKFHIDVTIQPAMSDAVSAATLASVSVEASTPSQVTMAKAEAVDQEAANVLATAVDVDGTEPATTPTILSPQGELLEDASHAHDLQISWNGLRLGHPQTIEIAEWLTSLQSKPTRPNEVVHPLVEQAFFIPGSPVALAVSLSEAGTADRKGTLAAIRQAVLSSGVREEEMHIGGSAVVGTELNGAVSRAAWDESQPWRFPHRKSVLLFSALVGTALAFVMLKRVSQTLIVLFVSMYVPFLTTAIVPVTGGSMNMVLVVMPSLLMVLTLSGAIHIVNYYNKCAETNPSLALSEAFRHAAMPCFLAALTTAIGLLSLVTSPLSPVRDFGIYSAIGMVVSLGMIVYGVPSLLQLWPDKVAPTAETNSNAWRWLGNKLATGTNLQLAACLALSLVASYGLIFFRTETKVIRYFPESSRVVQDYRAIENHLAGITPVEVIVRFDDAAQQQTNFLERMEAVREVEAHIKRHPEISGAVGLADFLPVSEKPEANASVLANARYNKRANTIEQKIRDSEIPGSASFYTMAESGQDLFTPGDYKLNRPGDELWRITAQVSILSPIDYVQVVDSLNGTTQEILKLHPGAMHVVTGTAPLFLRTQQAVLESLISSFGLAFVLILAVMVILLKNFMAGLVSMIPNVLPITIVFGLMAWFGQRVDIGSMITASVALGIAVDGTLHYIAWFQKQMLAGQTRKEAAIRALEHCGPAIWQTSVAVSLGLLVLMPSELLLISRFGWLMAALVAVAMLGDLILLPLLMLSPIGKILEPVASAETQEILEAIEPDTLPVAATTMRLAPVITPSDSR